MTRVTCKIKDVISEVKSGDWGKGSPTENYTTEVLCVRGADIPELCKGNVGKMPQRFIHNKKATSKILSANNLIIEISGGSPTQSTGRIALISDKILSRYSKPLICSNFCKAITATGIQPEYLFNYWLYLYNKDAMFPYENGTTGIKNLDFNSFIQEQDISIPDIKTQQKIVSILSSIDEKIETNKRINDNLEQQAQALFKSWFVDFEPFRGGEFVDSALGSTPKELPIVYIEDIPHNIESGKRPKGGATFEGVPSIGAENIKGLGYYDYSKTKYIPKEYAQTIKKGKINGYELLIYKDGGKPGYFIPNFSIFGEGFPFNEMYINEHVFILDLMDNAYNAFAYFYMRTPYIMNQLNSIGGKAAIPGINTKDIECLPIYSNESPYVKRYGDIVLPFIKTILSNSLENARLAKMRDTLLPQLMSGELKISE